MSVQIEKRENSLRVCVSVSVIYLFFFLMPKHCSIHSFLTLLTRAYLYCWHTFWSIFWLHTTHKQTKHILDDFSHNKMWTSNFFYLAARFSITSCFYFLLHYARSFDLFLSRSFDFNLFTPCAFSVHFALNCESFQHILYYFSVF